MEPTGRLLSRRQREKAKCEMWDLERGSGVERTRAPRSAREGAAETRPWEVDEVELEEGRRGPLGPQRRRSLMGLFLQVSRPDQSLCCCVGEKERTVRERDRELVGKGRR